MSCSEKVYGRKIIRSKRISYKIIILCLISMLVGFGIGRVIPREKTVYGTIERMNKNDTNE